MTQQVDGLTHRVALYIPGTTQVKREMDVAEHDRWVRAAMRTLSELFGGATAMPAIGAWLAADGELVTEGVTIVYAFARELDTAPVFEFARRIKAALEQEAVAVEIDGTLFFV